MRTTARGQESAADLPEIIAKRFNPNGWNPRMPPGGPVGEGGPIQKLYEDARRRWFG
jgi:hypothetical protein